MQNVTKYGKRVCRQMLYGRKPPEVFSEVSLAIACWKMEEPLEIDIRPSVLIVPPNLRKIAESVTKGKGYYPPEGCCIEYPGLNKAITSYP